MLKRRSSGILLHVTSLPSNHGIGDFGPSAYEFVDFLEKAGQNYWQILPLNYTAAAAAHSPYNCLSAFAGNPLLISPELLCQDGLLTKAEIAAPPATRTDRVDFKKVAAYKHRLFDAACERFRQRQRPVGYDEFVQQHRNWLEPFVTFVALQQHFKQRCWSDWPTNARNPRATGFASFDDKVSRRMERERFLQYAFFRQYLDLKRYCNERGIQVAGDIPVYVAYDSADVWSHRDIFKLTKTGKPRFIAGVPPDYFSETGQLWGNPVYDWQRLRETQFDWWMRRLKHNLLLFDFVRIDHFRGFIAYWQVPARHQTAARGKWVEVPHKEFFRTLFRQIPFAAIFAEDLGQITADVREVIAKYEFPCMRVLQFAFDGDPAHNPHMPHNHSANSIVYTGTHDNNTTRGWFEQECDKQRRRRLFDYLGRKVPAPDISWELIRLAQASVARLSVIPMQDVLGLGTDARMNFPSRKAGNWKWRLAAGRANARLARRLRQLTETYART
jgi:4-alpha-glucanotransferase